MWPNEADRLRRGDQQFKGKDKNRLWINESYIEGLAEGKGFMEQVVKWKSGLKLTLWVNLNKTEFSRLLVNNNNK